MGHLHSVLWCKASPADDARGKEAPSLPSADAQHYLGQRAIVQYLFHSTKVISNRRISGHGATVTREEG